MAQLAVPPPQFLESTRRQIREKTWRREWKRCNGEKLWGYLEERDLALSARHSQLGWNEVAKEDRDCATTCSIRLCYVGIPMKETAEMRPTPRGIFARKKKARNCDHSKGSSRYRRRLVRGNSRPS